MDGDDQKANIHLKEVTRLWRAWRTVHEMAQDRVCPPPLPTLPYRELRCKEISLTDGISS